MKFSPMWPIWADDICEPITEANKAWQEYIDELDRSKWAYGSGPDTLEGVQ